MGDKSAALQWIEKAYADRDRDEDLVNLKVDPKFELVRSEPRYHAMLHRMGLED